MSDGERAITPVPAPADDGRAPSDPPVVEATGIVKRFGPTVALNGARITIRPGETHALVGRNGAGKSTLVSVLTGLQTPDEGTVTFGGEPAPRPADRDAWRQRVACVYQKSTIIPTLTVAENLFLHRHDHGRSRLISWQATRRRAQELLATWSVDVDPHTPAGELSVEQRQFVEIARALSFGARFIILDEPTAQLDGAAINRLFDRIRDLQRQGVTFLFISHHLQEVYEICDMVTVFRDARHIVTAPVAELPRVELVAAMTGEAAAGRREERASTLTPGATAALSVHALRGDAYDDVGFQVGAGEIVGLAGAAGSGRTEVAETVVGLRAAAAGEVEIAGQRPRPGSVPAALAAGAGFVPQDRHHQGFVPDMSIADNATLSVPKRLGSNGFLSRRRRDRLAEGMIEYLAIKTPGPELPVSALSGGNQQKVVMARALANDPRLLVLINPTAGVDVRSKEFLLGKVEETAATGTGVLIASDELDDLRMCDRVLVMFQGRVTSEIARGWHDHDLVAAMEGVDLNA
ncbi:MULTISPECIES: sugar ABC transporter ATP-binding protein [Streptomyces]|uniref:Sugar ABC transporter ATP-binding protein n=1 Tax=Streptomyces mirabilis TaxID=68239 RepID=A0ABU3V2Q1_9ACTN|nr:MULTISPECIES: sugar ABC transporter ATP-binding protein [Streptomyces]MCX4615158.1 sugar ABC transporter ATP-binding protein [Streptomyces mirabilis]MCX5356486.1 sugar ABC transporter ATP-binding protein [Streptomyces mirabilis]MDU9000436.1 sugar ABC transporter ATP-binding protein [Streptomyces mirabilis]QDN75369.1 sugar ABC transporter ATP-binding protein [Streptomyces sp. S1A1-7]QDN84978.1 sugar ABC transporter ATP-binding protein [Streptomyces sp. RLB3-6]